MNIKKSIQVSLLAFIACVQQDVQATDAIAGVKYGQQVYVYVTNNQGNKLFLNMAVGNAPQLVPFPSLQFRIGGGDAGAVVQNGGRFYLIPLLPGARGYDGTIALSDNAQVLMFGQPFEFNGPKSISATREWGSLFNSSGARPVLYLMPG